MKMKLFNWAGILAGVLCLAGLGHAAFKDPLWSARVAALGGAYTAMGDDPTAAFYNPAAAVEMENKAANFSYAKLFTGLDEVNLSLNQLAYAHPLGSLGTLTAGWGSVVAGGLRREDTFTLGGAHVFKSVKYVGDISVGASLRYLSQSYTLDERTTSDPVFKDGRASADLAVDLHLYAPSLAAGEGQLAGGISLRALNQPTVGLASDEKLPLEVALGVKYQWRNLKFPLDIVKRESDVTPQVGVEALFSRDRLALRAGTDTHQIGTGLGYQHPLRDSLFLSFDYAFLWPLELKDTSGSHRASVGVKF
jgi:hypothetical protein